MMAARLHLSRRSVIAAMAACLLACRAGAGGAPDAPAFGSQLVLLIKTRVSEAEAASSATALRRAGMSASRCPPGGGRSRFATATMRVLPWCSLPCRSWAGSSQRRGAFARQGALRGVAIGNVAASEGSAGEIAVGLADLTAAGLT